MQQKSTSNTLRTVSTDNWCRTNKTLTLEQVGANS